MLWIQNVSPDAHRRPDDQPHDYVVRINNQPPLARFQHVRAKGAAACLRAAAGRRLSRPDGRGPETSLHFLQKRQSAYRSDIGCGPRKDRLC